ncbi:unnamed protein product, partial [Allacma fusca]
ILIHGTIILFDLSGPTTRPRSCNTSTSSIEDEGVVHLTSQIDLLESPPRTNPASGTVTEPLTSDPSSQQPRSIYSFMRRVNGSKRSTNYTHHPQTVPKATHVRASTSNKKVNNENQKNPDQLFDKDPEERIQKVGSPVLKTFERPEGNPKGKFGVTKRKPSEFPAFFNAEASSIVPISTDEEGANNVTLLRTPISVDTTGKRSTKEVSASGRIALRNATQGNLNSNPQKRAMLSRPTSRPSRRRANESTISAEYSNVMDLFK